MARFLCIELESAQVRGAEIEVRGSSRRIRNCFYFPAPQVIIDDGQIQDVGTLSELLGAAIAEQKIRAKKAIFVVSSSRIASREIELPVVKKKNRIQSIVEANAPDYFPVDVSQYVISWRPLAKEEEEPEPLSTQEAAEEEPQQPKKTEKTRHRLMAYACPKLVSTGCREVCQKLGLTLAGLDYAGDTIYEGLRETFSEGIHMLVKTEYRQTNVTIFRDGELALQRSLSYGVENAAEAVRGLPGPDEGMSVEEALDVLCGEPYLFSTLDAAPEDGDERYADRAEVTDSFRYLISSLSRLMDYYSSHNQGAAFDSIVLCGLGAMVQGLPELLGTELGQPVTLLTEVDGYELPERAQPDMYLYAAVLAAGASGVNLMERVSRKKVRDKDDLRGAVFVCGLGFAAGVILSAVGVGNWLYQKHVQEQLEARITEESSIEQVYSAYEAAEERYEAFGTLYACTNTPNEQLKAFIEELEQKMPSDIAVDSFSSTGSEATMALRVSSKREAADVLISLRTFESLSAVVTTGITEDETGTVTMTVSGTYASPAGSAAEAEE